MWKEILILHEFYLNRHLIDDLLEYFTVSENVSNCNRKDGFFSGNI